MKWKYLIRTLGSSYFRGFSRFCVINLALLFKGQEKCFMCKKIRPFSCVYVLLHAQSVFKSHILTYTKAFVICTPWLDKQVVLVQCCQLSSFKMVQILKLFLLIPRSLKNAKDRMPNIAGLKLATLQLVLFWRIFMDNGGLYDLYVFKIRR